MAVNSFPDLRVEKSKVREEVILVSHSNLLYWWPAWAMGYVVALFSYLQGTGGAQPGQSITNVHTSNNPGLLFIALIIGLIVFTNAKLRGIYSVLTLISAAFVVVLFAWLGWWDSILSIIPQLSAKANVGFYLVFSTALLVVWALGFFIFDRISYWRVRPGQFTQMSLVGGGSKNYDTQGMRFERREQDYFRHILLGVGSGDLVFFGKELDSGNIVIPNVTFVGKKAVDIERLISIKPDA
jgi:hypothetical protein